MILEWASYPLRFHQCWHSLTEQSLYGYCTLSSFVWLHTFVQLYSQACPSSKPFSAGGPFDHTHLPVFGRPEHTANIVLHSIETIHSLFFCRWSKYRVTYAFIVAVFLERMVFLINTPQEFTDGFLPLLLIVSGTHFLLNLNKFYRIQYKGLKIRKYFKSITFLFFSDEMYHLLYYVPQLLILLHQNIILFCKSYLSFFMHFFHHFRKLQSVPFMLWLLLFRKNTTYLDS